MSQHFKHVFSPLRIGAIEVRNRIVFLPHGTRFEENGMPGERETYYYAERAKGGVGLIVRGILRVHVTSRSGEEVAMGCDERIIPDLRKTADAVHEHGGRMIAQIGHQGRAMPSFFSRLPLWAPSPLPCPATRETPHEMDLHEIQEVVQGFIQTAANVKASGMDGVELHAAHGYLIQAFLSPYSNRRSDSYGGSLENRMRFLNEIVNGVRAEVGKDFVVGIRISADELVPGGLTLDDMLDITQRLDATGKLDYFSVDAGTSAALSLIIGDMNVPLGTLVSYASAIKQVVHVPVIAATRINDPVQAEGILADGHADLIGMCRELICDPEFANKASQGRADDIRKCVACLQDCRRHEKQGRIGCVQNPAAGFEKQLGAGTLKPAAARRKVIVVGGGPAGMEAARVAALRGHDVTLYEKGSDLGGQVRIAAIVPNREEFGGIVRHLSHQVRQAGVKIVLGSEASAEAVLALKPDAVVVATGATPLSGEIPGSNLPHVLNVLDAIQEKSPIGEQVAVVDAAEAFWQCYSTVEFLVSKGKQVTLISRLNSIGVDIPTHSLPTLHRRLISKGVRVHLYTDVKEIREHSLVCVNKYSGEETEVAADSVVMVAGNRANDSLYASLKGKAPELHAIGDCLAPRKVSEAIREGHLMGRQL